MRRLPAATGEPAAPERGGTAALLMALAGGPTLVTLAMLLNLVLVRPGCEAAAMAGRIGLVALALGGSAFASLIALRQWRRLGTAPGDPRAAVPGRNRFLAIAGLVSAAGSVAGALYFAAVLLFLELCWFA